MPTQPTAISASRAVSPFRSGTPPPCAEGGRHDAAVGVEEAVGGDVELGVVETRVRRGQRVLAHRRAAHRDERVALRKALRVGVADRRSDVLRDGAARIAARTSSQAAGSASGPSSSRTPRGARMRSTGSPAARKRTTAAVVMAKPGGAISPHFPATPEVGHLRPGESPRRQPQRGDRDHEGPSTAPGGPNSASSSAFRARSAS